jgi:ABC-2 type transport system ATP-binding protein
VAEDTPQNLGERLRQVERIGLQVAGGGAALTKALTAVPGVVDVKANADGRYEVEVTPGQDIRAQLAATIVKGGWGLLELSRVGMSLEEIFLQLTQEESPEGLEDVEEPPNGQQSDEHTSEL